jgi:hypothetical protein
MLEHTRGGPGATKSPGTSRDELQRCMQAAKYRLPDWVVVVRRRMQA